MILPNTNQTHQKGFSLVELMVALTLGLLLIAGLGQVFVGSKQAFRAQEGVSDVQENGRFAIDILGRQIRLAGYRPAVLQPPQIDDPSMPAGSEAIFGFDNTATSGRAPGSDVLLIAYEGAADGGVTTDCMGNAVAAGAEVVNAFFINAERELRCTVNDASQQAAGQPLLEGISDMQILYGVDNTACGTSLTPNTGFAYVTANNVIQWCSVRSIRIDLTVDSLNSVDPNLPNGGVLQRTYSATVQIRNGI